MRLFLRLCKRTRDTWDRGDLRTMVKHLPAKASGTLISIVGHITVDELRCYLDRTEIGNGFANRFLYLCVRRSKCLPEGGQLTPSELTPYAQRITSALGFARRMTLVRKDESATIMWRKVYPALSQGMPGLFGAVTSRAEAQVIRLAMLYALLDQSGFIQPPHLEAALAVWEYAEGSARYIFGGSLGNPLADEILRALRAAPSGLARTEISGLFKRNKDAQTLSLALDLLAREGYAQCRYEQTEGRPIEIWIAT
jgi:hypothetical protein